MKRNAEATIAVKVNDRAWTRVTSLRSSGPADNVYALDSKDGRIRFGDGVHGRKPTVGSTIGVTYRYGDGSSGNISKTIDDEIQLTSFWVIARDGQHAIGWGKRPC